MVGKKAEYEGVCFLKVVCGGAWPKDRQAGLTEQSLLQGVTDG